jgi:hypothetical protein
MADANVPRSNSRRELDIASMESKNKSNDNLQAETNKLLHNGTLTATELVELKRKYNDSDILQKIMDMYSKKYHQIYKKANKIADAIIEHYSTGQRPFHEIIKKALKYKTKYNMNDVEYDLMRKILTQKVFGNPSDQGNEYNIYNPISERSRIGKVLGSVRPYQEPMNINKDTEMAPLQEIISLTEATKQIHTSVFMQSLMYQDCGVEAMTGEYDRKTNSAVNHISPVLAAMFLPKIGAFDVHMLYASIGSIVKSRYERKQIMTQPDQLLFQDLINDPNDVTCDVDSAIGDLRNRFIVQTKLWQTVIKLRNGQYYEPSVMSDFMTALQNCRNNLYDNTDLLYNKDEGDTLRKLLSVFSFRPTFIATTPIFTMPNFGNVNPLVAMSYNLNNSWQQQMSQTTTIPITSVPMVVLRLPNYTAQPMPWNQTQDALSLALGNPNASGPQGQFQFGPSGLYGQNQSQQYEPIDLRNALSQTLFLNEKKTIVPKIQNIIYSKDVLIIYINRRVQKVNLRSYAYPFNFNQLPLTITGFERLNKHPVTVPPYITLGREEETFQLRSVVTVEEIMVGTSPQGSIITGSTALIAKNRNPLLGENDEAYFLYDPFGASIPFQESNTIGQSITERRYAINKPISIINQYTVGPIDAQMSESFYDRARTRGTIFIYAKPRTNNNILY